jgi:threonine dehydratase
MSVQPELNAVHEARQMLGQHFPVTRLIEAPSLRKTASGVVFLKLETELPTGSFKVRGALYTLALNLQRRSIREVVASSTGNHGAAVAYAAKILGVKARIFLPVGSNPVKRSRIVSLGAEIIDKGRDISDAFEQATRACASSPEIFFMNDATNPDIPSATGVIALEILEQHPSVRAIFVPMGDTALIRGIAGVIKQLAPSVQVIGVQAEEAPAYYLSWKNGEPVTTNSCNTIADGLATRTPVRANVEAIRELVDDVVLVSDQEILRAVELLLFEEHLVVEPAGAASSAALLKGGSELAQDAVLVVSGANISREILCRALENPR